MLNWISTGSAMHKYNIIEDGVPPGKAERAIVLLHGRGGTAEDIITLAAEFNISGYYIAAPQASGNTWYPYSFLSPEETNEQWLSSALQIVKQLLADISIHIPAEKTYLMGFSQGACLALEFAARFPVKYAGIAAFSGGLIGERIKQEKYSGNFEGTKIFIGNSDTDPHIPLTRTDDSAELLKKMGAEVLYKVYRGMGHTISADELSEVKKFMF